MRNAAGRSVTAAQATCGPGLDELLCAPQNTDDPGAHPRSVLPRVTDLLATARQRAKPSEISIECNTRQLEEGDFLNESRLLKAEAADAQAEAPPWPAIAAAHANAREWPV
mmetsp:Transcript_101366/g.268234  ORF Transcript_101366/g.268234 Transcript_101366/m.268234 type:complete len:111 (-) Transcript_101366:30-362(-)